MKHSRSTLMTIMEDEKSADVSIRLCKHCDAPENNGPWPGSLQFYLQKAYHQTESHLEDINPGSLTSADNDEANRALQQVLLEIDLHDEKPWRADRLADFFNYDLNERSFREYVRAQIRLRFQNRQRTTLGAQAAGPGGYLGQGGSKKGPYGKGGKGDFGGGFYGGGKGDFGNWRGAPGGQNYGVDPMNQFAHPAGAGNMVAPAPGAMPGGAPMGGAPAGTDGTKGTGPVECESLYVLGFPSAWQKSDLQAYFGQFGIVVNCHIMPAQEGQRTAGIVNYVTVAMAREAIAQANGKVLPGNDAGMDVRFKMPGRREQKKGQKQGWNTWDKGAAFGKGPAGM
ncbi:unnamed protein product [Amoebophrya sp. A25]|nr:unnamed protein product [Amoebophrya sp. A25]|eukprot:GSA25T00022621001.1